MAQRLSPELIQHIIDLITPFMGIDDRRAYIDPWCIGFPNLYRQIDWAGAAQAFTTRVVTLFLRYGLVTRGKTAIEFLLESVRGSMGIEDQTEIDDILREIRKPTVGPPPRPQSPETPPRRRSCTLMITFVSIVFSAIIVVVWSNNQLARPAPTEMPTLVAISTLTQTATPTRLLTMPTMISVDTPVVIQIPTNKPVAVETSTAVPPTPTLIALMPTNSPVVEPTVSTILTVTSTPTIAPPVAPVCLSIIGYHNEEALKNALIEQAGFSNQSDNLVFENGDAFAEVCITGE